MKNNEGSGSGFGKSATEDDIATRNRSRKDYIIAIEDNAPMNQRIDPVFQMLQRLAKRTQGKMAIMDYSEGGREFGLPIPSRLRYRNEIATDDSNNANDDNDDDGYDDENENYDQFNAGFGSKQRLIGSNVIQNLLGMKYEDEKPRQRDDIRGMEGFNLEENNSDSAPAVVYEIKGNGRMNNYDDEEDDDEDQEGDAYSRGFPGHEPMFLFGDDKK